MHDSRRPYLCPSHQASALYQAVHKQLAHVKVEKLVSEDRVHRYKAEAEPLRAEAAAAKAQAAELETVTLRQMDRLKALARDRQLAAVGRGPRCGWGVSQGWNWSALVWTIRWMLIIACVQ